MATGVNISVAGGTSYSVQYNLDGASHLDTYVGTNMPLPFPEALQEFKLATSAQDATQGGGHSGATVDAVTKSGSNNFHGDAFEFFRNYDLNGRDFFSPVADGLKRNQFGGVIGGPIKKDKLFFFLGYEGTMIRQYTQSTIQYVPTSAELTGNFGPYIAAGCPGAAGIAASPIVHGGQIVVPLSPAALKISSYLPQSNNVCGQVFSGIPLHENESQAPVRLDYNISPKHMLFARYIVTKIDIDQPYDISKNVLSTDGQGANDESNSLALGDTYLFSTSVVNSFRVFGNRVGATTPGAQTFGPQQVGINNFYDYYGKLHPHLPCRQWIFDQLHLELLHRQRHHHELRPERRSQCHSRVAPAQLRREYDARAAERPLLRLVGGLLSLRRDLRLTDGGFPHRKRGAVSSSQSESRESDAEFRWAVRGRHLEDLAQLHPELWAAMESLHSDAVQAIRHLYLQPEQFL